MFAIPSPDVLMSLFASAAQVMGLLVLCLGGGMLARRRMPGRGVAARPASRWPLLLSVMGMVGIGAGFLLYHLNAVDQSNRRLQVNLVRSSQEAGKQVGDTSLKTLSYSDQARHGRGVSTEQLAQRIAEGRPLNLIDVRESEEVEMGGIRDTWHRRYPDLQVDREGLIRTGMETVLLCESGNRSSELSNYFQEHGIETGFLIGGYEKWKAEEREMVGGGGDNDLRALPDFGNKRTLLDTDEAVRLYLEENALFVDVRYPKEFEASHLPDAVNLTLRKMQSDQLAESLGALPRRPIVVPCYDKRSSFYALILGVKLARLGYDFRGRYTVPHEFTLPEKESAWVARWQAQNSERTLFGDIRGVLAGLVLLLERWFGSLALAIVLAALLLRALLAPVVIKAERDGIVQRRGSGELGSLRQRLQADPVRLGRATFAWLRARRITPGRNLLGSMLQLLAFTLFFAAVDAVCADTGEVLLWMPLTAPDPAFVLPTLAGLLLLAIVLQQARSWRLRSLLPGIVFVGLVTALVVSCRGGVQIYLAVSFAAMVFQGALVRWWLGRGRTPERAPRHGLVSLRDAAGRAEFGGKASRLGEMVVAGFPVPDGCVVAQGYQPTEAELDRVFRQLGTDSVAVRSSAQGEDGAERSFAGEFRTVLDVRREGLRQAIAAVRASYRGRAGGVVIQGLVPAEQAGVMFTEDPAHAGRMLVEMVDGLGEGLVSGTATPREYRFRRSTWSTVGVEPEFDLRTLLEMGRRLEDQFGAPQDIEWARAGGSFQLLQSRNVTARAGDGSDPVAVREAERAGLLLAASGAGPEEVVFATDDFASLLPAPTAFSLGLMQELWAPGGSVDLASRRLGLSYRAGEDSRPYVRSVFGRCCVDRREARTRLATGTLAAFRLGMASVAIERGFEEFLPVFQKEARLRAAMDLTRLGTEELHELCSETRTRFVTSTYVEAEVINLAAENYVAAARSRLERAGLDAAALLGQGVETVVQRAFGLLAAAEPLDRRCARFQEAFGHRAVRDFELSEPRFGEQHEQVRAMALDSVSVNGTRRCAVPPLPKGRLARTELLRARRFQELKEAAKDAAMRELALLRGILLELGERHGLGTLVFHLAPREVEQLRDPAFAARAHGTCSDRHRRLEILRAVPLPDQTTAADLEHLGEERPLAALPPGMLRGARVAGDREPVGRVVILRDPADIRRLEPGDILVVRCTDPCWLPAFRRVGGLVTEIGGWLSHAAIQAREHNLPAIVGASNATWRLQDGELVKLRRDGAIEVIPERRTARRLTASRPIQIRCNGRSVGGRLLDVTASGAMVSWETKGPPRHDSMSLRVDGTEIQASLAWTNCTRFGIRFAQPLPEGAVERLLGDVAPVGSVVVSAREAV